MSQELFSVFDSIPHFPPGSVLKRFLYIDFNLDFKYSSDNTEHTLYCVKKYKTYIVIHLDSIILSCCSHKVQKKLLLKLLRSKTNDQFMKQLCTHFSRTANAPMTPSSNISCSWPFSCTAMPYGEQKTEGERGGGAGVAICTGQESFSGLPHHNKGRT